MTATPALLKKALRSGAFFLLLVPLFATAGENCGPPGDAPLVKVRYVPDGDTLVLADDTHVRLIGINTPEMAHDGEPAQPLAVRARDHLRYLLFQNDNQVRLLEGEQRQDRHRRTLAYLWLPDGADITSELLRAGLGWLVAIPPDTRFLDCHEKAEADARYAQRGVWAPGIYPPLKSGSLSLRTSGFHRVRGRVVRVNHGGGATWINLQGRFAVRVPDADLREFPQPPTQDWVGRELEVRGWIYQTRGELRVNVSHPANLQVF
jgi:endonuclease YncB( thermonuclease family)